MVNCVPCIILTNNNNVSFYSNSQLYLNFSVISMCTSMYFARFDNYSLYCDVQRE